MKRIVLSLIAFSVSLSAGNGWNILGGGAKSPHSPIPIDFLPCSEIVEQAIRFRACNKKVLKEVDRCKPFRGDIKRLKDELALIEIDRERFRNSMLSYVTGQEYNQLNQLLARVQKRRHFRLEQKRNKISRKK